MLERDEVFAGLQGVEHGLLGLELFVGIGGGLDGKADAAVRLVNLDDARGDFLADLEHVLDFIHAILADLRDVDEAVNLMLQADECAEAGELGDLAGDEVADLVELVDVAPGIHAELFDADSDALVGFVDFQHHGLDFVALLEDFGGMIDLARPRDVRDVDHAVETFLQLDEGAVAGEIANLALDAGAGRIFLQRLVPRIGFELADAEGDFLLLAIDAEHDGFDVLILLEHVARLGNALGPGKLSDVNKAFDARLQFHKRAVRHEVDDLALDLLADGEFGFDVIPRIGQLLLEAEADAFLFLVDVEYHNVNVLADLEDFARVPDAAPGHVGDVQQAVETVEVDERAEVGDVLDRALADIAGHHFAQQLLALL